MVHDSELVDLLGTTDAYIWAETFVRQMHDLPETAPHLDKDFMVGWFANAMAAEAYHQNRYYRPRLLHKRIARAWESIVHVFYSLRGGVV
jgi:hypothetical protein